MSLVNSAKGEILRVALKRFTDGDTGSTILGLVATAILASGVNFEDLFSTKDEHKQALAIGTVAGSIAVAIYGFYIGKKKPSGTDTPKQ